jgi:hypothetical protein
MLRREWVPCKKYYFSSQTKGGCCMCTRKKAHEMMDEIEGAIFDIHEKFGTPKNFGYSFLSDDTTGEIKGINIAISAAVDISPLIPPDIKGWHPVRVEKKLLPILRSVAGA